MDKRLISGLLVLLSLGPAAALASTSSLASHTAQYQQLPKEQVLDGVIEAVNKATVSAQVSGRIISISVDVDDYVEKGTVIARVRDKEYKARLRKANAALKSARAQAKDAQLDYDRMQDMVQKKLVSQSKFDQAKARLKSTDAQVNAAEAQVTEAKEQLANTIIRAPYAGVVTERHIEIGEMAAPGKSIMTGLAMNKLRATVQVPQTFINAIRRHQQAHIILEDGRKLMASELTIFPVADPLHHTFRVRVQLPEGTARVFPGMLVKAAFTVAEEKNLLLPLSLVTHRSEVSAVYIINDDGRISLRQVRLGNRHGKQIEILSGLNAGEKVAQDPIQAGIQLKAQAGGRK
jgi:RND family efflux transporter MFP subunit